MTLTSTNWDRAHRGAADRAQLGVYAVSVAVALSGQPLYRKDGETYFRCMLTGRDCPISMGEIDRANGAIDYLPGNVIMVSKAGNQGRSTLQQHHGDMKGAKRYASDVARASASVVIMRKKDAIPLYRAYGRGSQDGIVTGGPYGIA